MVVKMGNTDGANIFALKDYLVCRKTNDSKIIYKWKSRTTKID